MLLKFHSSIQSITETAHCVTSARLPQPEHVEDDDNEDDDQQGGQGHHDSYNWHFIRLVVICRNRKKAKKQRFVPGLKQNRVSLHLRCVSVLV